MLDIRRALQFITDDDQGLTKAGIGLLLLLVPILNIVVVGYEVEVARRVARGDPRPLPPWDDFSGLFVEGAWLSLARLIYALPLVAAVLVATFGGMGLVIMAVQSSDSDPWRFAGPLLGTGTICFGVFILAYALVYGFASPALIAQYEQHGTLAACFDFRAIWGFIQRDPGQYLTLWLTEFVLGLVLGLAAAALSGAVSLIPCIGTLIFPLITSAVAIFILLVNSHLVGQLLLARQSLPARPALTSP